MFKFKVRDKVRDTRPSSLHQEECRILDNKILTIDNYFPDGRVVAVYIHNNEAYSVIMEDKYLEKI